MLRLVALGVVLVLLVAGIGGYLFYRHLNGNIDVQHRLDYQGRPTESTRRAKVGGTTYAPMNILLLGSDTRQGQTGKHIGGETPGLSDTAIVLHLSADRKRAYGVSIPRDSMVQMPSCPRKAPDTGTFAGGLEQFNSAYAIGGAPCTAKTVETLTGLPIDHFVVVDFTGFKSMVDALGGVKVCVPRTVNDTIGHIYLQGGTYTVSGEKALDYVRIRDFISPNGDIGRIARQQAFLASMTNKAVSAGTLANPLRLAKFLNAATSSLTTDEGLDTVAKLVSLGRQLQHIGLDHVRFLTVPTEPYPANTARVQWAQPAAGQLWGRLRADRRLARAQRENSQSAANGTHQRRSAVEAAKARAAANGLCYPGVTGS